MRFVALVSGGKDSIYSTLECIRNGHELVACVHLGRPTSEQEESYMYQTAASEVVRTLVEDCLGVPLLLHQRVGTSVNTSLVYEGAETASSKDEVEDLYVALKQAKEQCGIQAVSSGAILSTYQRVRIENVCSRLELTSLSYLWRLAPQKELLKKMLDDGIEAVVVRAACPPGLVPQKHLNKSLRLLWDMGLLEKWHRQYQFHVCGEGGEYESLVVDSPLHQKRLVLDEVEVVETDDGVGDLRILKCHAEAKTEDGIPICWSPKEDSQPIVTETAPDEVRQYESTSKGATFIESHLPLTCLPHVQKCTGGIFHISEVLASKAAVQENGSEAELAVTEAIEIFDIVKKSLETNRSTAKDVMFAHLYLSEMGHFANINAHYANFFGTTLPPSRSCVAVGKGVLPGGRRVMLDCMVQAGSGEYMRNSHDTNSSNPYMSAALATTTSRLREVLHVQSISHWAPVCVGPYSQVNTLRSGIHFMAGQIGLIPATMQLRPTWEQQLEQCWKNVAAVLDSLEGGSLEHLISCLIYVSSSTRQDKNCIASVDQITSKSFIENGNILAGHVDALVDETELYGGYEDQDTWNEMKAQLGMEEELETSHCPVLVVTIPEMPKAAGVEIEVVAATKRAATLLSFSDTQTSGTCPAIEASKSRTWDTGHDFVGDNQYSNAGIQITSSVRVLGKQNVGIAIVTASADKNRLHKVVSTAELISDMLSTLDKAMADGRTGLSRACALHFRIFHISSQRLPSEHFEACDDGVQLRSALLTAMSKWTDGDAFPATSIVPVCAIDKIGRDDDSGDDSQEIILALQATYIDPVHLETNIWIRKDREYNI